MKILRSSQVVLSLLAISVMLAAFSPLPARAAAWSDTEADGLAFMREEEKLARDL